MNNIFLRGIFGALFVAVMVICCFDKWAFLSILFLSMQVCVFEFSRALKFNSKVLYLISGSLYFFYVADDVFTIPIKKYIFAVLIFGITFVFIKILLSKRNLVVYLGNFFLVLLYTCVPFIFIAKIPFMGEKIFDTSLILSIFIFIWVGDTFAYLFGKYLGTRKLFERISPHKTAEGFLAGIFFTIFSSVFIAKYCPILSFAEWFFLSFMICILAPLGDLIASKFKRELGCKDFGTILRGHGGFLDRFDSLIFAAPAVYIFLNFIANVS